MKNNIELQKKYFENHKAEIFRSPEVEILRFKNPESREYEINFLFDKKNYTLAITGDLGTLVAQNENNMSLEKFHQFLHNPDYFYEKVLTMSRPAFIYDGKIAKKRIEEDYGKVIAMLNLDPEELQDEDPRDQYTVESLQSSFPIWDVSAFWIALASGFNVRGNSDGWSDESYAILGTLGYEAEDIVTIGRERSGILELYLMAFELAAKQVRLL